MGASVQVIEKAVSVTSNGQSAFGACKPDAEAPSPSLAL